MDNRTIEQVRENEDSLIKEIDKLEEKLKRAKVVINVMIESIERLHNIIKEVREEIRMLESNCDISDYQAQKLYQLLDKGE